MAALASRPRLAGARADRVDFEGLPELNNDHVLDPDGEHIYMSAMDGHIYRGALGGGAVDRVTPEDGDWHFLHGVSPDGSRLAYVHIGDLADPGRLAVLEPHGPPVVVDTGPGTSTGPSGRPTAGGSTSTPRASPTSRATPNSRGSRTRGGPVERLVTSDTVDWFPHLSPDAQSASYITFPAGTLGHPADLDVEVRVVATSDWSTPLQRYPLFGGQGTINVNSWSPDSSRFAFVAYPVA